MEVIQTNDNGYSYIMSQSNRLAIIEEKITRLNALMKNKYLDTEHKESIQKEISFWGLTISKISEI